MLYINGLSYIRGSPEYTQWHLECQELQKKSICKTVASPFTCHQNCAIPSELRLGVRDMRSSACLSDGLVQHLIARILDEIRIESVVIVQYLYDILIVGADWARTHYVACTAKSVLVQYGFLISPKS